ncbi:hypothetical protein L6R49_10845 [Myxococcota bacterium]|nr:hypothetical protein [Myxococcota bacterium]
MLFITLWSALFIFGNLVERAWRARAGRPFPERVTTQNGVAASTLALLHGAVIVASPALTGLKTNFGGENTPAQAVFTAVLMSFMLVDAVSMAVARDQDRGRWLHHGLGFVGAAGALFSGASAAEALWSAAIAEASLCFYARGLIVALDGRGGPWDKLAQRGFTVVFLIARLLLMPILLVLVVRSPDSLHIVKLVGVGLTGLGFYWSWGVLSADGAQPTASPTDA